MDTENCTVANPETGSAITPALRSIPALVIGMVMLAVFFTRISLVIFPVEYHWLNPAVRLSETTIQVRLLARRRLFTGKIELVAQRTFLV